MNQQLTPHSDNYRKHLKTRIIGRLQSACFTFVTLAPTETPHKRGVHYLTVCEGINTVRKAMDTFKEGRRYGKRIVVRPSRHRRGLHELYTYHIPSHWSEACIANRNLIKAAQRLAHAIEHDHSFDALQWRVRFLHQYYALPVWKRNMTWVPVDRRRYAHFYTFVFTTIYRALKAAADSRKQCQIQSQPVFEPVTEQEEGGFTVKNAEKTRTRLRISKKSSKFARFLDIPISNETKDSNHRRWRQQRT